MARFGVALSLFLILAAVSFSFAQADTGSQAIGLPAHGSFSGSDFDNVQLNNGNLHIEIPLYSLPGRGLSANFKLVYDSKGWYEYSTNPVLGTPANVYPRGTGGDVLDQYYQGPTSSTYF